MLFAAVYQLASFSSNLFSFSSQNRSQLLLVAPKLAQATLAAITDVSTWKLAQKLYGHSSHAAWTTVCIYPILANHANKIAVSPVNP